MVKIHDWNRIYWRNASGGREFFNRTSTDDLDEDQQEQYDEVVGERDRALYENENGDLVGYRVADEEAEHGQKYEVFFEQGDTGERSVIGDVTFEEDPQGWIDEEQERDAEVELAAFGTRGDARKFTAAWRAEFGSPEDLGYVQFDADELPEDYDELQDLAGEYGIKQSQSGDDLRAQLTGEEEPEFVNGHQKAQAQ